MIITLIDEIIRRLLGFVNMKRKYNTPRNYVVRRKSLHGQHNSNDLFQATINSLQWMGNRIERNLCMITHTLQISLSNLEENSSNCEQTSLTLAAQNELLPIGYNRLFTQTHHISFRSLRIEVFGWTPSLQRQSKRHRTILPYRIFE